jgi:hypothetical protein
LKPNFLFDANLLGLLMVVVSFVVELILEDLIFALLCDLLLLLELLIRFLEVVVDVARVVPSSGAVVLAPLHETEPAEAELAFLTSHVHTALVLLDETLALGTRLGVGLDPGEVLAVAALLLLPDANHGAGGWQMVFVLAGEAEGVAALAVDCILDRVHRLFSHVIAPFLRTPFDVLILICHLLAVPC